MRRFTEIEGIKVDNRIFTTKFSCDYTVCKGACCNKPLEGVDLDGGSLTEDEANEILHNSEALSLLCDEEDRLIVAEQPVHMNDVGWCTTLSKDKCSLCSMLKGTCVLNLAKEAGITHMGVPLSCQLYPIVVDGSSIELGDLFDEFCACAYEKGKRENIYLLDFLKDPLVRGFGEKFYHKLKDVQKMFL